MPLSVDHIIPATPKLCSESDQQINSQIELCPHYLLSLPFFSWINWRATGCLISAHPQQIVKSGGKKSGLIFFFRLN